MNAENLVTVPDYQKRFQESALKPIIYNAGTLSISPKALTIANTVVYNKTYDATNVAVVRGGSLVGLAAGDDPAEFALSQAGTFASIHAGSNIGVTVTGSITGTAASNYTLTQPTGLVATINKANVTISGLSVADKIYDTFNTAVISGSPTVIGLLGADTADITSGSATATFAQSHVGNNLPITVVTSDLILNNDNYQITGVANPLTASITPAPITISAAKTYDGSSTLVSNQLTVTGVAGQTLILSAGTTGTLTNPNVGSAQLVSLNDAILANGTGLASNYTIINPVFSTVTINPAPIILGMNSISKVYDTTTNTASAQVAPVLNLISGRLFINDATGLQDVVSGGSFAFTSADAGINNRTVNISNASIVSGPTTVTPNYAITYQANTTSTITRAPVTVSGLTPSDKTYDNNTTAVLTGTPVIATGLLGGITATLSGTATSGSFDTPDAGTGIRVTPILTGLSVSNPNYYVAGASSVLAANIDRAPLTIGGLIAADKVYDTTANASLSGTPTIAGLLTGTTAGASGDVSGTFASPNVGTSTVTVDLSNLTLSNPNYFISGVTSPLTATINPAPLIIDGLSASNKVFNNTDAAVISGTPIIGSGLLGSDAANLSGSAVTGTFASSQAGLGIAVTPILSNLALSNSNYYIAGVLTPLVADITPAPLTISGLIAANKVYDANAIANISGTPALTGLISGVAATVSGNVTGVFVSMNAADAIPVTVDLTNWY
jgi:mucin-19